MLPQYAQQQTGGEIAIWLLITVGALLVPIIVIAICCIRRHCWKTLPPRRPRLSPHCTTNDKNLLNDDSPSWAHRVRELLATNPSLKLMELHSPRTSNKIKQSAMLRSYNGPYIESNNDHRKLVSENGTPLSSTRTNSLRKQHVHWPAGSITPKGEDLRSIKDRQFTPRKQPLPSNDLLSTNMLTESPSSHRRVAVIPTPSSALSHLIQTAIIPAGSTVTSTGASQLFTSTKQPTNNHNSFSSIV